LDFSKIEAGKMQIESFPFDLRAILEEVAEMLAPQADEKGLDLVLRYPAHTPSLFISDADRIRQVVTNLVGNAIKFTQTGQILVSAECLEQDHTSARMIVSVADTGIGIAPEKFSSLFEKFSQADASTTRKYGGTGLGLSISKNLVELMGGSIEVKSELGVGSTFQFTLTLALDDQTPVTLLSAESLRGLRVLIVDDNEVNRRVVHEQVLSLGMRNGSFATSPEALAAIREARTQGDPYDLIIADFQMPEMDGATLAATIKADAAHQNIVFVLLTSISNWRTLKGLEGECVDATLLKPVRLTRLVDTLTTAWSKRNPSVETRSSEKPPPAASAPIASSLTQRSPITKSLDELSHRVGRSSGVSGPRVLVVEDNAVNQKVAVLMLKKLGFNADVAGNGREGAEMLRTLPYDIVLMDCQMPEMNGYEATAEIRSHQDPNACIPIIAMTANASVECRELCLASGMNDFITKPVNLEDLADALGRWLPHATAGMPTANIEY